ncbi:MAG: signal peptidase I [Lachnospiraceae bacterium]|jgi:signal peptidase I|nr:signal peptidase I [Lachnospiraceae bacterium]
MAKKTRKSLGFVKERQRYYLETDTLTIALKWAGKVLIVVFLAFILVWFYGQRISTVGDSMNPALENGEVVLVDRIVYNAIPPKRGDLIAFKPRGNENAHFYIRRIIGLPGETVEIKESEIYIDGEKLEEEYEATNINNVGIATSPIKLAEDEYFVLGDNRLNSDDSRSADVGNVKREYIFGKVWFTLP